MTGASDNAVPLISRHVRIIGRVQGVWYRRWTVDHAQALQITGWVRNCADGTVEAVLTGPQNAVEQLIERCWDGPQLAKVDDIVVSDAPIFDGDDFSQRPSRR